MWGFSYIQTAALQSTMSSFQGRWCNKQMLSIWLCDLSCSSVVFNPPTETDDINDPKLFHSHSFHPVTHSLQSPVKLWITTSPAETQRSLLLLLVIMLVMTWLLSKIIIFLYFLNSPLRYLTILSLTCWVFVMKNSGLMGFFLFLQVVHQERVTLESQLEILRPPASAWQKLASCWLHHPRRFPLMYPEQLQRGSTAGQSGLVVTHIRMNFGMKLLLFQNTRL